uniref:Guanine nucleotide exchange factor rei n=1 Tax=Caenorhabditis tropicalis TaxID=1561998 RepID=A0A1I7T8T9_9PELO
MEETAVSSEITETFVSDQNTKQFEDDGHPPLETRHLNMIHEELEKLNISTDVINKMEVQLDTARADFRETQIQWSEKLKELSKQYSSQIAKARPFYELKIKERTLREESQKAAERFERATSILAVAKKQVSLTQESLSRQTSVLPECLEVLNHHIQRVRDVEEERMDAESLHASKASAMLQLAEKIRTMEKDNRYAIKKSRLYFEKRLEFTKILEAQKATIICLEAEVRQKKNDYTTSLRNLEKISDRIHEERSTGSLESAISFDRGDELSECADSLPGNPPPYSTTAPPPYEDKYFIDKDDDSVVLNMMKAEKEEEGEKRNSRSIGSGVILLAQQLIGNGTSQEKQIHSNTRHGEEADITYHTRPVGLSDGSDNSEVSSLASFHIGDDDTVSKMLMSHSELIKDIELATDRVGYILKPNIKSVSNAHE